MENYIYLANLAEQAERYDDVIKYMTNVVTNNTTELTEEQIKPLITAYKNVVEKLRFARRTMQLVEAKEKADGNIESESLVNSYRYKVIQEEIYSVCTSMLKLLDKHLLPCSSTTESKVYYLKVKGDYNRYLAEVLEGDDHHKAANDAIVAYSSGLQMAHCVYGPRHPLRLGLALNFSVFYYEILDYAEKACSMVQQAFIELAMDEEEEALDERHEPLCQESTVILGLLRKSLNLWTSKLKETELKSKVSRDVDRWRLISF